MNWKQFLKPDWKKIVIFVVFFILMYIWAYNCGDIRSSALCEARGFPLIYWNYHTISKMPPKTETNLFYFELIVDLIIWYLLSCLIAWIYDKLKKPKKKA